MVRDSEALAALAKRSQGVYTVAQLRSHEDISLGGFQLGDADADSVRALLALGVVKKLYLMNNQLAGAAAGEALGLGMRANSNLVYLGVFSNKLGPEAIRPIAQALATHECLRVLNASFNPLGDAGCAALAKALRSPTCPLHELILRDCQIGDDGALALARALAEAADKGPPPAAGRDGAAAGGHGLRELTLEDNAIGDAGAEALLRAGASDAAALVEVDLSRNRITSRAARSLVLGPFAAGSRLRYPLLDGNPTGGWDGALLWIAATAYVHTPSDRARGAPKPPKLPPHRLLAPWFGRAREPGFGAELAEVLGATFARSPAAAVRAALVGCVGACAELRNEVHAREPALGATYDHAAHICQQAIAGMLGELRARGGSAAVRVELSACAAALRWAGVSGCATTLSAAPVQAYYTDALGGRLGEAHAWLSAPPDTSAFSARSLLELRGVWGGSALGALCRGLLVAPALVLPARWTARESWERSLATRSLARTRAQLSLGFVLGACAQPLLLLALACAPNALGWLDRRLTLSVPLFGRAGGKGGAGAPRAGAPAPGGAGGTPGAASAGAPPAQPGGGIGRAGASSYYPPLRLRLLWAADPWAHILLWWASRVALSVLCLGLPPVRSAAEWALLRADDDARAHAEPRGWPAAWWPAGWEGELARAQLLRLLVGLWLVALALAQAEMLVRTVLASAGSSVSASLRHYFRDPWSMCIAGGVLLNLAAVVCAGLADGRAAALARDGSRAEAAAGMVGEAEGARALTMWGGRALGYGVFLLAFSTGQPVALSHTLAPRMLMVFWMVIDVAVLVAFGASIALAFALGLHAMFHAARAYTPAAPLSLDGAPEDCDSTAVALGFDEDGLRGPRALARGVWATFELVTEAWLAGESAHLECLRATEHGLWAWALQLAFVLAAVCLLLNLLIAQMAKTFDVIHEGIDEAAAYARAGLVQETLATGFVAPPPLNLIGLPARLVGLCLRACGPCFRRRGLGAGRAYKQLAPSLPPPSDAYLRARYGSGGPVPVGSPSGSAGALRGPERANGGEAPVRPEEAERARAFARAGLEAMDGAHSQAHGGADGSGPSLEQLERRLERQAKAFTAELTAAEQRLGAKIDAALARAARNSTATAAAYGADGARADLASRRAGAGSPRPGGGPGR